MRRLIVNADDYGLTPGISRGILEAHARGIVTSTSALAVGPAFDVAARWLGDHPALGVGIHLALSGEDRPLLSAREIPTLIGRSGGFCRDWRRFALRALRGAVDPCDVRRELAAQVERILAAGVRPTHIDAHQHLHLWPLVREEVLALARRMALPIRVPRSTGRRPVGWLVNLLAGRLAGRARGRGVRFPSLALGFDEAGRLDRPALTAALARLTAAPAAVAELGCHPGRPDADCARYRWGYRWADEVEALCDPALASGLARAGVALARYDALSGSGR